ncbi:hypothetical protein ACFY93_12275 [Streptomyces sp. NPDC008313]|uniref:hypothetical protein n=1 Tax=Streptomyces sp. NPDC008313 TaxID=3364826 RepID=UPI0036EF15C1
MSPAPYPASAPPPAPSPPQFAFPSSPAPLPPPLHGSASPAGFRRPPAWSRPPGPDAPPGCEVPLFPPLRVRGGRCRSRRLVRHRRRAVAAGLAVAAVALVAADPGEGVRARGHPAAGPVRERRAVEMVRAPVRIADVATVRLLRPGDRVDVVAADSGGDARVVAAGARVTRVPDSAGTPGSEAAGSAAAQDEAAQGGALVVLSVPRPTAARLAGAGAASRLAVTLC